MVSFLLFLLVIVLFFYTASRVNSLQAKINKLEKRLNGPVGQSPKPSGPIPEHEIPLPKSFLQEQASSPGEAGISIEQKLGSKLFTIIGAIAVLFGVGFFLRFAFEQNLINETARVVLGIIAGTILIAAGEYLREKYKEYGQVLQGTGIGVFYLSFFAAHAYYSLIGQPAAFAAMILVTLGAVFLAVRANSQPLSVVAQFGAYLTPLVLNMAEGDPHKLFAYITLVNIGALYLAMRQSWRNVTPGSLLGTAVVYVTWHASSYSPSMWVTSFAYQTLFYLTFLAPNIYRYFIQKRKADGNDLALVLFNPLFYFMAGSAALNAVNMDWVGWFAFALSAVYFFMAVAMPSENDDARVFHFGVSAIMFFIGVPVLFEKSWVTIGWGAEAAFLLYYALRKDYVGMQFVSHAVFMLASLRLYLWDLNNIQGTVALANGRALSFLVMIALLVYGANLVYQKSRHGSLASGQERGMEVLAIQAQIAAVVWTAAELIKFGNVHWMGLVWAALGVIAFSFGIMIRNYEIRIMAYLTLLIALLRAVIFDSEVQVATYTPLLNMRVLAFLGVAFALAVVMKMARQDEADLHEDEKAYVSKGLFIVVNLMILWVMSLEITSYFMKLLGTAGDKQSYASLENSKRAALSVAWSLYAGFMLAFGIAKRSAYARLFSISLFSIVIFKVFLYDTANLSNFYRFVSFISLGVILLIAGYLYNRYKERVAEFIQVK